MNELINFYKEQVKIPANNPLLATIQAKGLAKFDQYGFPTRHQEEWKYTNLDAFLKQSFIVQETPYWSESSSKGPLDNVIEIKNGRVNDSTDLPKGVIIKPLMEAIAESSDILTPYLDQLVDHQHGFQALNSALLHTGIFIYLPQGVCLEKPILLSHWQDKEKQAIYNRYLIIAENGSAATLIEDYQGAENITYLTNSITELFIGPNASITHYKIERESRNACHLGHIAVKQAAQSKFFSHSLCLGGQLVRSDVDIELMESGAFALLNGIYVPQRQQLIDHHTVIYHYSPNCHSQQDYRGILQQKSRGIFNGKIVVAKNAVGTEAHQQNKNLLLSAEAEINTKPQLNIFADDVTCSHGATVGQLDEEALFYLATRGIDQTLASQYLIEAFAANNFQLMPDQGIAAWAKELFIKQLSGL